MVGSVLVSRFGLRQIYRAFGITAGTAAILYFCSYHWWLKRIEEMRLAAKEGIIFLWGSVRFTTVLKHRFLQV